MKTSNKILLLREARGSSEWHLHNFLSNISRSARLMHKSLAVFPSDRALLDEAARNYVIALVSAMETFYRDLFIYLSQRDSDYVNLVLQQIKKKLPLALDHPDVTPAEIASVTLSFQRFRDVDTALSVLLDEQGYFEALSSYKYLCALPSQNSKIGRMGMQGNWREELDVLLSKRHQFVHDSNSKTDISPHFMQSVETTVLMLGQVSAAFFFQHFGGKTHLEDQVLVLLTIDDLIAEDWTTESPPNVS